MAARSPTFAAPSTPAPTSTSNANAGYFLGIELSNEQLRAALVDEHFLTLGVEVVDFDVELPEYHTRSGLLTAQDGQVVPVELWIRGLDRLFERLRARFDLSKLKTIGGCAQLSTVWWRHGASAQLAQLSSTLPLHQQLSPSSLALLHVPVPPDTATQSQSLTLESTLGAPGANTAAHLSLAAAQILKVRESEPDAWAGTERVMLASAFVATLLLGRWAPMSESEISATGLWDHPKSWWDEAMLELLAGSKEEGARLRTLLGEVERAGGKSLGTVAPYFVERYGVSRDAFVVPFTSEHLAAYLSICPSPSELVLSFGPTDVLMTPAKRYRPSRLYNLHPHPAQSAHEKPRWIAAILSRNADKPRELVRDLYTKSWSAFDRLVSVIPPGGSIGLDDKLFSFWVLQGESFPFALVKGVFRFETGIKVTEFRDLRANPRSLVESQVLSFRVRYARMMASGVLPRARSGSPTPKPTSAKRPGTGLGLSFDPYDYALLPKRLIVLGSAANFPSVVNLLADVFNAPVFAPLSDASVANAGPRAKPALPPSAAAAGAGGGTTPAGSTTPGQLTPTHTSSALGPSSGGGGAASTAITMSAAATQAAVAAHLPPGVVPAPSRASAALGSAYTACWAYRRKTRPDERFESFEEEVRSVLRQGAETERAVRKAASAVAGGVGGVGPGAAYHSGATTPLARSGLGIPSPLLEHDNEDAEDDDDETTDSDSDDHVLVPQTQQRSTPAPSTPAVAQGGDGTTTPLSGGLYKSTSIPNLSASASGTTLITPSYSSNLTLNTAFGSSSSLASAGMGPMSALPGGAAAPTTSAPATLSVAPLPSEETDIDLGLVKVSDCDIDSFMMYAALVPEYCRLEGMLVRALV